MLKRRGKDYEFSITAQERDGTLRWGEEEIKKMERWTPEQIRERLPYVESILQGFRDMADTEHSYLVDTGSPYNADKEPTFKVVKISHPGIAAKNLTAVSGKSEPQG